MIARKIIYFLISCMAMLVMLSCYERPNVLLEEEKPGVGNVVKPKIPGITASISEIEAVNGQPRVIFFGLGSKNKKAQYDSGAFRPGVMGYIFSDSTLQKRIGKFQVLLIHQTLSKAKIIEVTDMVTQKCWVLIEMDSRYQIR